MTSISGLRTVSRALAVVGLTALLPACAGMMGGGDTASATMQSDIAALRSEVAQTNQMAQQALAQAQQAQQTARAAAAAADTANQQAEMRFQRTLRK